MEFLQGLRGTVDEFDDRPGFGADFTAGKDVPVLVGDAFEVAAGDAVADGAVRALLAAAAAAFQMEDFLRTHPREVADGQDRCRHQMAGEPLGFGEVDGLRPRLAVDPAGYLYWQRRPVCHSEAAEARRQLQQARLDLASGDAQLPGEEGDIDQRAIFRSTSTGVLREVPSMTTDVRRERAAAYLQLLQVGAYELEPVLGHGVRGADVRLEPAPGPVRVDDVRREVEDGPQRPDQERRHGGRVDDDLPVLAAFPAEVLAEEVDEGRARVLPGRHHQPVLGQQVGRVGPHPGQGK
uniref:Uncharacterized protein n=1 Tax=Streptomyces sp. NBC_00119 TaxID=2975659 RepID=A0AAU1UM61_9ACTN